MTENSKESENEEPTKAWFIVSIILGVIGGIIGYFAVKSHKQKMANRLLKVGIYATVAVPLWVYMLYAEAVARNGITNIPGHIWLVAIFIGLIFASVGYWLCIGFK